MPGFLPGFHQMNTRMDQFVNTVCLIFSDSYAVQQQEMEERRFPGFFFRNARETRPGFPDKDYVGGS